MNYYHNEACYFAQRIQVCINQLLNPFTTFSDEKQQKIRRNKQIFRQKIRKYIVFTHIGRACERHRGYGSNSLWIDQSGSFFNPVWPEPLNDGSNLETRARILCGGLLRLWETPVTFARKSVHLDPVLRSTFINRHYCRQTRIMPLIKLITTLILQRTLAMVLNCFKILVVIYFNLFNYGKSWIVVLF